MVSARELLDPGIYEESLSYPGDNLDEILKRYNLEVTQDINQSRHAREVLSGFSDGDLLGRAWWKIRAESRLCEERHFLPKASLRGLSYVWKSLFLLWYVNLDYLKKLVYDPHGGLPVAESEISDILIDFSVSDINNFKIRAAKTTFDIRAAVFDIQSESYYNLKEDQNQTLLVKRMFNDGVSLGFSRWKDLSTQA